MTQNMIYVFSCGCRWDDSYHDQLTATGKGVRCPKHRDARLIERHTVCVECGKKIISGPNGGVKQRCKSCGEMHKKKMEKQYNSAWSYSYDPGLSCGSKAPERKQDCLYYDACLTPPAGRLIKNQKACINCPHYKPGPGLDVMDYVKTGGQMSGSRYCVGVFKKYDSSNRFKKSNTDNNKYKEN